MTREEAIVHTIEINRLGQSSYFQVELPSDTTKIIGVETSAIRKASGASSSDLFFYFGSFTPIIPIADVDPPFVIHKTETVGILTLQSPDTGGIFFQGDVRQKDISSKYADFTQYPAVFGQWSHDRKRHETSINVSSCSKLVEGHFKDTWGALYSYHVIYQFNIYIWVEKKVADDNRICS